MSNKLRNRLRWMAVNLCRLLLTVVFAFSGVVKLIDPRGTEYKIQDYAQAFGLSALIPSYVPLILSVGLALLEFCIGIYLFFSIHRLRTTRFLLLFMFVVTPLTLYLALTNPVSDCGCFGDALLLSNWQTFGKNVVLLLATLTVVAYPRYLTRLVLEKNQWMISLYTWFFGLALALINIYRLPIIDFRPYHIGADLREKVLTHTGEVETLFVMEKNGERREFTLDEYPDSTWTFVDTHTIATGGSTIPELADFVLTDICNGDDVTEQILMEDGYQFLIISPRLERADDGVMDQIATLTDYCVENGYSLKCLTASEDSVIQSWTDLTGAEYEFYHADEVVLKTMIRSNPGLMLLHDGKVVNKWADSQLPSENELIAPLEQLTLSQPKLDGNMKHAFYLFLWYIIPLLVWTVSDRTWVAWKLNNIQKNRININQIKNKRQ